MLKMIREAFEKKDKKFTANLLTAFALGILLIVCGSAFFKNDSALNAAPVNHTNAQPEAASTSRPLESASSYESRLEKRLEEVYATVEGAGKVSVMLTLSYGREIVVAEDTQSRESGTKETDDQGGVREQYDRNSQETKIIISGQPLILKEIEPKVEGVIIVAQGGDNVFIADALIRATQTVLGVEPHKVQVLKMKE